MAFPADFFYFVISGFVLMLIPIGLISWFQSGFFFPWIRTRASRGKKILIKQRGKVRDHFTTGKIDGDFLIFGKEEHKKRILIDKINIYTCWGVSVVDIDESSNNLATVDYTVSEGFDAEKYESLYTRTLYRPLLDEGGRDMLILVLIIIIIIAVAVVGFLTWTVGQQVASIGGGTVTSIV